MKRSACFRLSPSAYAILNTGGAEINHMWSLCLAVLKNSNRSKTLMFATVQTAR